MLRMRNKYCSNCLSTQRFLDLGACLVCERCSKRLERVGYVAERAPETNARTGPVLVAWAAEHREAI